jgi:hypothetical protein
MKESLVANKWYPQYSGPGRSYRSLYPTPQSILRRAVGAEEYKFVSETVTTEHIRASCIIDPDVPFQHLLAGEPWGMSYRDADWRMLIVSTLDPLRWIELARASGARAWLKGHTQTYTYNWEPPPLDEHGLKRRPPNALGITGDQTKHSNGRLVRKDRGAPKKYNPVALLDDLREDILNHSELAAKHGVSRITVWAFAKRNGFTQRQPHHGQTQTKNYS